MYKLYTMSNTTVFLCKLKYLLASDGVNSFTGIKEYHPKSPSDIVHF